jgi:uncharacterized protein YdaU (DUF1376 family)
MSMMRTGQRLAFRNAVTPGAVAYTAAPQFPCRRGHLNYYRRFPGDYLRDTQHLTVTEHGIYNLLLDHLYSTEKPIASIEDCYRISRCTNSRHRAYCKRILSTFFHVDGLGIWHKRVQEELNHLESKSNSARAAANVKWERRANAMRTHNERNATPDSRLQTPEESKPTASPESKDFRFSECKEIAYKDFKTRYGSNPTWSTPDYTQLTFLIARNKELTVVEFSRRWQNFLNSTEKFTASQGGSLKFFCSRFDSFIEGALMEKKMNGGKLSGRELTEHNLRVAGFIPSRDS